MIQCSGDLAYTLEDAKELERHLIDANVKVSLTQVEGAHYGVVCNPEKSVSHTHYHSVSAFFMLFDYRINPLIREAVLANNTNNLHVPPLHDTTTRMPTPFTDLLKKHGFDPDLIDSDDDGELIPG